MKNAYSFILFYGFTLLPFDKVSAATSIPFRLFGILLD